MDRDPLGPVGLAPWRRAASDPWYDWFRFAASVSVLYGTVAEPRRLAVDPDFQAQWRWLVISAEYLFSPNRPRTGTEAHDAADFELERFMHLHAMNRGILLTPFHNMALMSPATEKKQIDHHSTVFREALKALVS